MSYQPQFTISVPLLSRVETIAALRERIQSATVQVSWIPSLQKDSRARNAHSSTAIEGNPLTLEEVRALEANQELTPLLERSRREVLNYFAALRYIENNASMKKRTHEDLFHLHAIMAGQVMDQGEAGAYRKIRVRVGPHIPPPPSAVSGLMFELLEWWNKESVLLSPVLSSAILHYRFEDIHPFADGNGRTGRALALWELYRRGFDSNHIFSVDEYFREDRPKYYAALQEVRINGDNLTSWLEYNAEGLQQTLERVWKRIQQLSASGNNTKLVLRPKQEQVLNMIRARGGLSPREIREGLDFSKQGAMDVLNPLIKAGLIERIGTLKNGRYVLK
ncbi:MAG: Fic family protein [Kiritimatiellae bacterium]|nr:Fic family protein [Kiritimatiellia bacterium]MDD4735589.1 Fic family protein [Kiritimatiellia bacterium]